MKPLRISRLICLLWILVVVLMPALSQAGDSEDVPRLPLAMEVFLKKPQARVYELHIHLTNIVSRMDGQDSPVKQRVQDWNLGSRVIQLLPGESVQDTLLLNPRMSSLLDDIAQFGVQIRWDCPPSSLKFVCHKGSPQILTIPKGDAGRPDVYSLDAPVCLKLGQAIGLIRIPEGHEVLFLLTSESVMVDLPKIQALLYQVDDYVQQCDEGNKRYFEEGIWQQVNIGQYSSQIRTLFRFPWIKKRADDVYVSVYR
jgi:hypothetical protein